MKVLGFDPGVAGAYALLDHLDQPVVGNLPLHNAQHGKTAKVRHELDLATLRIAFASTSIDHVFIERVNAMPGQGVTSMFRFGDACGCIRGLVVGLGLRYTYVTPQEWQKFHKIGPSPDAARQRAVELYPELASTFAKKNSVNMADALLIAVYGMMKVLV